MATSTQSAKRQELSLLHRGNIYRARYYVKGNVVIVDAVYGKRSIARNQAILGGSLTDPLAVAQLLLIEMIDKGWVPATESQ